MMDRATEERGVETYAWQRWEGDNVFVCQGRFFTGPDWQGGVVTLMLLLVPSALFFAIVAPLHVAYIACPLVLLACILVSFFYTAWNDPGIIPRREEHRRSVSGLPLRDPPHIQQIVTNGRVSTLKFCYTCRIYRPERCSHCAICDNCVLQFDHHCPWLGACIGARNYRWFIAFTLSLVLYAILLFSICVHVLLEEPGSVLDSTLKIVAVILAVYAAIAFAFVASLVGFHLYLVFVGKTTNEHLKSNFPSASPFTRGCFRNFTRLCFGASPPAQFDAKKKVSSHDDIARTHTNISFAVVIPDDPPVARDISPH